MSQPSTDAKRQYTAEEYFAMEEASPDRHEYVDGDVVAKAGESDSHSVINANVIIALGNATDGTPCRPLSPNMQVRTSRRRRYRYADTAVVCGERAYEASDAKRRTLLNPTLIVEVLSDGTERKDRGEKFSEYREIASFREYVLIAQDQPRVETFLKQDDGTWRFASFVGLDATVPLPSIGVTLTARQIYKDVIFPPPEPDDVPTGT